MKEIVGIGFEIPSNNENDYTRLDSLTSLSEYDIVVISPNFIGTDYSADSSYNGKSCYNHNSSRKINEHSEHWKREIISFLKSGKTVFINLVEHKSFYIQTGRTEYSGTGRNRQATNIVTGFDNYNFLPVIDGINFNTAHGKKIITSDSLFKNFLFDFEKYMAYTTYISEHPNLNVSFTTKNKDKILGGYMEAYGGHLVFLPNLDFDIEELYSEEIGTAYSKEAKILGLKFKQHIVEIDNALRNETAKTARPIWLNETEFQIKNSQEIQKKIEVKNQQIKDIEEEIEELQKDFFESEKLNDLLFETGKPLENAVTYALTILGFKAENFDDGKLELDQVITSPEGVRFIGECEGKDNKQIDITKFRQLSDSLNEDFEREDVKEKAFGLLFGNPFRLILPNERPNPFTEKCISGANREKIGLIETRELYKVAKYLLENKDSKFQKKCRQAILNNLGKIIVFPEK